MQQLKSLPDGEYQGAGVVMAVLGSDSLAVAFTVAGRKGISLEVTKEAFSKRYGRRFAPNRQFMVWFRRPSNTIAFALVNEEAISWDLSRGGLKLDFRPLEDLGAADAD